jgi:hypothetical protein
MIAASIHALAVFACAFIEFSAAYINAALATISSSDLRDVVIKSPISNLVPVTMVIVVLTNGQTNYIIGKAEKLAISQSRHILSPLPCVPIRTNPKYLI